MSKKTVKDLDFEFKTLFHDLQVKFNLLSDKHEALEKKYDELILKKSKEFRRDKCDKVFTEEQKFKAHCKIHVKNYSCEVCERTFKCEDILGKHHKIAHENLKFYCQYFNNSKNCPFKEECVFLHEISKQCKFGIECERQMCMFRHDVIEEIIDKNAVTPEQILEEDETNDQENEISNRTFNNPSQIDKSSSDEISNKTFLNPSQVEVEAVASDTIFKCEKCGFEAGTKVILGNHKESRQNWCYLCYSSYKNKDKLKNHITELHSDQ